MSLVSESTHSGAALRHVGPSHPARPDGDGRGEGDDEKRLVGGSTGDIDQPPLLGGK
jgi:hypothetical protein